MSELQGIYLNTNKPLRNKFGVRENFQKVVNSLWVTFIIFYHFCSQFIYHIQHLHICLIYTKTKICSTEKSIYNKNTIV